MPTETLTSPDYAAAQEALCPDGPPRVWSLIVTVFGDTGGDVEIGAGPLAQLLAPIGVSGAAMRVALHRLKADRWITARRVGRSSAYRLHPDRMAETRAASARIYDFAAPPEDAWHIVLRAPDAEDEPRGIEILPRVVLRPGRASGPDLALLPEGPLPEWVRATLAPPDLVAQYEVLLRGLRRVARLVEDTPPDGVHAVVLRMLVVHAWRRAVLRHPVLPDALYPEGWAAPACRTVVAHLLTMLPRPDAKILTPDR